MSCRCPSPDHGRAACAACSTRGPAPGCAARSCCCFPLGSLLDRRHFDEMTHLLDLSAQRLRVLLHDRRLVMLQADRLERAADPPRMADPASYLLDLHL